MVYFGFYRSESGAGRIMLELVKWFQKEVMPYVVGNGISPRGIRNYHYRGCNPSSSFRLVGNQVCDFRISPGDFLHIIRNTAGKSEPEAPDGCGFWIHPGHSGRAHDQPSAEPY